MNIRTIQNKTIIKAPAKINLGLDIIGSREDGYHLVKMVMQTVTLYDELTFWKTTKPGVELICSRKDLPVDQHNLVVQAAKLIQSQHKTVGGIGISLEKNIPIAAGLAGGSADAAATLIGINELYNLKLSIGQLEELGLELGADVPYCISGGTMLSEGIGEKLTPIGPMPQCYIVMVKPLISISTQEAYRQYDKLDQVKHPDISELVKSINQKKWLDIKNNMGNVLEMVSVHQYPVIEQLKKMMIQAGAYTAMMSGSGPTVFGLFMNVSAANRCVSIISNRKDVESVHLTQCLNY